MKQKMQAFLAELVPDSTRGKELQRFMSQTGAFSGVGFDEYEHVTVVKTYSGYNDTITVTFRNAGCQQRLNKSADKRGHREKVDAGRGPSRSALWDCPQL